MSGSLVQVSKREKKLHARVDFHPTQKRGIGAIQGPELRKKIVRLGGLANKRLHGSDDYCS